MTQSRREKIQEAIAVANEILQDARNTSEDFMTVVLEYVKQSDKVDADLSEVDTQS